MQPAGPIRTAFLLRTLRMYPWLTFIASFNGLVEEFRTARWPRESVPWRTLGNQPRHRSRWLSSRVSVRPLPSFRSRQRDRALFRLAGMPLGVFTPTFFSKIGGDAGCRIASML